MKVMIVCLVAMTLLVGCNTFYYKKSGSSDIIIGYEDTRISEGLFRVKFVGRDDKSTETYKFFLRRCAELTIENGYNSFIVENGGPGQLTRGFHNIGAGEIKHYTYEGSVRMHKGKGPKDAFDAKTILKDTEEAAKKKS